MSRISSIEYRRLFSVKSAKNRGCCYYHVTAGMAGGSPLSDRATVLKTEKLPSAPDQGKEIFLSIAYRPGFRFTFPVYWVPVSLFWGGEGVLNLDRTYVDYNRNFIAEVKNAWSCTSASLHVFIVCYLITVQEQV